MAVLLEDALTAGALGMSDNLHDHDGDDRAIPTLVADDAEFEALFAMLQRYPGTTYQCFINTFMCKTGPASLERLGRLTRGRGIRMQIAGAVPTLEFQKDILPKLQETLARLKEEGANIWPGYAHASPTSTRSLIKSLIFAQSNDYVWHEVVLAEAAPMRLTLVNGVRTFADGKYTGNRPGEYINLTAAPFEAEFGLEAAE